MYNLSMKLQILKMQLNSSYGTNTISTKKMVDEIIKTMAKFNQVDNRRKKLKRLYGGR